MLSEKQIEITNKLLSNKVFTYRGPMFSSNWDQLSSNDGVEIDFDYTISLSGYKQMITIGEYMHYLKVDVNIIKSKSDFIKRLNDGDAVKLVIMNSDVKYKLLEEIKDILTIFAGTNVRVLLSNITVDDKLKENIIRYSLNKKIISESKMNKEAIRTVVKDVITKVKNKKRGFFYLPDDYEEYSFSRPPFDFSVELTLKTDKKIDRFMVNGYYVDGEQVVEILVVFNPNKILSQLYDLVGELNELLGHELEHGMQEYRGEFMDKDEEPEESLAYYSQEHEIPAQYQGFKRLSKLTKKPIKDVAKNWFDNNKDIHGLNNDEVNLIIDKILSYKQ